jgi:bla regulator protein BlaR1
MIVPANRLRLALAAFASLGVAVPASGQAPAAAESADRVSYVFFEAGGDSSSMSGSMEDMRRARALRSGNEGLLYVRSGGAGYVIRDAATLRRADAIFAPQRAMGARQGELGRQQGELGRRQGELGRQQGELGRRMADATAREMGELGRQMGELGRRQGELGRQQGELGRRQGELGREQGRLAVIASNQIRALVADALRRGLAKRVD